MKEGAGFARLRCAIAVAGVLALAVAAPSGASASRLHATGLLKLTPHPNPRINANQSSNWFGYNQGSIEQGGKLFNSITSNWTVPKATQHTKGQAEYSATWIGIGGGCVDANCTIGDATLIQTGTEQDVSSSGSPSYSAWWEIIPAPAITINMKIVPGDRMYASVAEAVPFSNVWTITLKDLTRNENFSQTVPYSSSHLTAEWIDETPLIISSSGTGISALPNLTETPFDNATVNGSPAGLKKSEQIVLVPSTKQIGTPSAPDSGSDGFGDCTWTTSCSVPAS
jgi:hypothetical protein